MSNGILETIQKREQFIQTKIQAIEPQEDFLLVKIDSLMSFYQEKLKRVKELIPRIDQMKGVVAGIKLCVPVIEQQQLLWKKELKDDKDQFKQVINVLSGCASTMATLVHGQKEALLRSAGCLEEAGHNALSILDRIEKTIDHHYKQLEKEEVDDTDERLKEGRQVRSE